MRASGILLPIFSLPSPHGIGTLGKEAYNFVDFLKASGQQYWQILPIGPTGYGDSPYQSFSAFAGNPYFIDLDMLLTEKLLTQYELSCFDFGSNDGIDYLKLFKARCVILHLAAQRVSVLNNSFIKFCEDNAFWLDDYALFMSIKGENKMVSWQNWAEELRLREEKAMLLAKERLADEIHFWRVVQFLFYAQWGKLKRYANKNGVKIIGDIPIYVSPDSSDIWAQSELFETNSDKTLYEVAGVPPDGFSDDGQLWGNPLYAWENHKKTGFAWWVQRLSHAGSVYDLVRIDHFRGFASYYAIPAGDKNARRGRWRKGPGSEFIDTIKKELPRLKIIAEDLGFLTPEVRSLLAYSGFPGMKVLQFAFDSREESDYLPHNYGHNSVVYTGTHDNTTTEDWFLSAPKDDIKFARFYLDLGHSKKATQAMVRAAEGSVCDTAIIPMQDWLELGAEARINTPSTLGGNWQWRLSEATLTPKLEEKIYRITQIYGRIVKKAKKK
ncbi:MAG: 4-alpha-glucanotransferase [Hydrogenoanaerobacterium sp.]